MPKYNLKKYAAVLTAVLLITALTAGCSLLGFTEKESGPWVWAQDITSSDIAAATPWNRQYSIDPLSKSQLDELVSLLNALQKEEFTLDEEPGGCSPEYGLRIECADQTYNINESLSESGALVITYGGDQWFIDNVNLSNFIRESIGAA